jgi:hypothetical protein
VTKYTAKTKPFRHQSRATIHAAKARNFAIFFEPRCGKSKAALDTVGVHALAGRVKRVLIICPAIARDVWETQIEQHYPYPYTAETFTETWQHSQSVYAGSPPHTEFFIAGREETFRRKRNPITHKYERPKQRLVEAFNPDLIIIDESHEYQQPGGVGGQDCWKLVRRLRMDRRVKGSTRDKLQPWVLLLSGTPNPKGWRPLFSQFRIMDEKLLGTTVAAFDDRHVVYGHGKQKWTIMRYRDEGRLERILRENSIAISAEEAGLANTVFMQKLHYSLPARAVRMYDDMVTEFVAEWEDGVLTAKNAGVKRLRLLQILGGYTTDGERLHDAAQKELKAYAQLLREQGESVVVYSRFTAEVVGAYDTLAGLGFRTHRVDGSTSDYDRRVATRALAQRPDNPTAISAQVQSLSQAVELVGAAEVVYMGVPDGWTQYFQTSRRVMGPNQHRPVRLSFITVPGSVHNLQMFSLRRKEDWHQKLMRDPRRYLTKL